MWLVAIDKVTGNLPFRLGCGTFVVGRTSRAHIVVAEATVSRKHARLIFDGTLLLVHDLGSSNGTFVNEVAVSRHPLQLGDHVRFGSIVCAISSDALDQSDIEEDDSTYEMPAQATITDTLRLNVFTAAQQKVVPLLMKGLSEPEIAAQLGNSRHTIHAHIRAIFEKLDVHTREELIVKLMSRESATD